MQSPPVALYLDLMGTIRDRFDVVRKLAAGTGTTFARAESAAFQGRKIIEGIAFGCLVATENGLKHIPRDAKGQWNAEAIMSRLSDKGLSTFPSPSMIRTPTDEERQRDNVTAVVEGVPALRISVTDFVVMYQRMHRWLHELNPYVAKDRATFLEQNGKTLWDDLSTLERFVERHFISISGEGFFCVLRDRNDGNTKVIPLSKASA